MAEVRSSGSSGCVAIPLEVNNFVDYIWEEATGQLEEILAVTVDTLKTEQVDKAEASLLSIRRLLDQGGPPEGVCLLGRGADCRGECLLMFIVSADVHG